MAQLCLEEERIKRAGGSLVVIGNGPPNFIQEFREKTGFFGKLYTDPERSAYRALGLRSDIRSLLNLKTLRRALRGFRKGYWPTRTAGNLWQQGGVFVVDRNGKIVFSYPSQYVGDHPTVEALIGALENLDDVDE